MMGLIPSFFRLQSTWVWQSQKLHEEASTRVTQPETLHSTSAPAPPAVGGKNIRDESASHTSRSRSMAVSSPLEDEMKITTTKTLEK